MKLRIQPVRPGGIIQATPSKSYTHRWMIAAALSGTGMSLHGLEPSEDTSMTLACLQALGAQVRDGHISPVQPRQTALMRCGESGTTLRLMLPIAAALGVQARFLGEGRLPLRPIGPLLEAMQAHGVHFDSAMLPLTISGRLQAGQYTLPGDISSQLISGLMLALPLLDSGSVIHLSTPLVSSGYVRMTMNVLECCGIFVGERDDGFLLPGSQHYRVPSQVSIEGDWTAAAPFLVMGALGGDVAVRGLPMDSLQGDREIVDLLRRFGAAVGIEGDTVYARPGNLRGSTVDVSQIPDLVPSLAVLGAAAQGVTRLVNAEHLRHKESDRLQSTCAMLHALGVQAQIGDGSLTIQGGSPLRGGEVDGYSDHRIIMAAAAAATIADGAVAITCPGALNKSYPGFLADLRAVGGHADVVNDG